MATVVAIGTLDTKGAEYGLLRERLLEHGVDVILGDAGLLGEPTTTPDIPREERARAAGEEVERLAGTGDRGAAVETMSRGAAAIVERLHREGRLDAIVGMGGTGGTALVTHAMQRLPVGVPRVVGATGASGSMGGPEVVSLGGVDMVNFGPADTVPEKFRTRTLYVHNPTVTLMRTTPEGSAELGRGVARKRRAATGPAALFG